MTLSESSRKVLEERLTWLDIQRTNTQAQVNKAQQELDRHKDTLSTIDKDIAAINVDLGRTS